MRNWRKYFTWFILLVNLLFLVLAIAVGASTSETVNEACQGLTDEELELCTDVYGYVLGGYGALIAVFLLWAAADFVLGILWLVTRKRNKNKNIDLNPPPPS